MTLLLLFLTVGCSTLPKTDDFTLAKLARKKQAEAPIIPDRILAIWKDTVLHRQGQPAQRGFGGRLFFYKDGDAHPIEIEGSIIVYAFDATETDARVAPEKKFVFPAETLHKHYSKCSIGDSYSFWLPWDKVGGETRQISLITRFEGTHGGVLISEPASKLLPGVSKSLDRLATTKGTPANIVRVPLDRIHVQTPNESAGQAMRTHTIGLPSETATRFANRQTHEAALEQHLVAAGLPTSTIASQFESQQPMIPATANSPSVSSVPATTATPQANGLNPMRQSQVTYGRVGESTNPLLRQANPIRQYGSPPYQPPAPWQSSTGPTAAPHASQPGRLVRPPSPEPRLRPGQRTQVQVFDPNGSQSVVQSQYPATAQP
ncbi:MAG: hypothetical protein AAF497_25365 [Planctomycetota bacterium]